MEKLANRYSPRGETLLVVIVKESIEDVLVLRQPVGPRVRTQQLAGSMQIVFDEGHCHLARRCVGEQQLRRELGLGERFQECSRQPWVGFGQGLADT